MRQKYANYDTIVTHSYIPMMNKSAPFLGMKLLQKLTVFMAFLFCCALVFASGIEVYWMITRIIDLDIHLAVQEGLFVLILLEMFFVVRSFIKYGSVNTALIISVGIVAIVKEVVFKLDSLTIETSIGYAVLFLAFSVGLLLENRSHLFKIDQGNKPRSIREDEPAFSKTELLQKELVDETK